MQKGSPNGLPFLHCLCFNEVVGIDLFDRVSLRWRNAYIVLNHILGKCHAIN